MGWQRRPPFPCMMLRRGLRAEGSETLCLYYPDREGQTHELVECLGGPPFCCMVQMGVDACVQIIAQMEENRAPKATVMPCKDHTDRYTRQQTQASGVSGGPPFCCWY
eukprot:1149942-Pelagomonas_calceolata.AAC.2